MRENQVKKLSQLYLPITVFINGNEHHFGLILVDLETHFVEHALDIRCGDIALAALIPILEDVVDIGPALIPSAEGADDVLYLLKVNLSIMGDSVLEMHELSLMICISYLILPFLEALRIFEAGAPFSGGEISSRVLLCCTHCCGELALLCTTIGFIPVSHLAG